MKKVCLILAFIFALSLAACGTPVEDSPAEAVSTLSITGLEYAENGIIEDFQVEGTIVSNQELVRIEVDGEIIAEAAGDMVVVSYDADPYYFEDGTYSTDMSTLTEYFVEHYNTLYNLYLATVAESADTITAKLYCTCYDASDASESFALEYVIAAEETDAPVEEAPGELSITGLGCPESGDIEGFYIAGTISSEYELDRIECVGQITSDALGISVGNEFEPFCFEEGMNSVELASVQGYLTERMTDLLTTFETVAGLLEEGGEAPTVTLTCTCYDAAGNTVNFTVIYKIITE